VNECRAVGFPLSPRPLCLATIAVGFLWVEAAYRLSRLRRRRLEPETEFLGWERRHVGYLLHARIF
jgi:hypothetical protein